MGTLSPTFSIYLSALFPCLYVVSIYLREQSRLKYAPNFTCDLRGGRIRVQGERWRDDNSVIKARLYAVSLSTICSLLIVAIVIINVDTSSSWITIRNHLGFTLPSSTLLAYGLVPLLYIGALLSRYLAGGLPFQRNWSLHHNLLPIFQTTIGLRNFVVAPLTEELVFRSCVLAIMRLSEQPKNKMIFLSPLWFGCAHLHRAFEMYDQNGRTSKAAKLALLTSSVQFLYTTFFGWLTAFLFLSTGSVLPCITSHIFCNIMGLPIDSMRKSYSVIFMQLMGILLFALGILWLNH